ncbi:lysine requiring protein [Vanrija albida]|uniref:Lysine requiring protein n=1 Tax=Vanrija albida TaxID=181172 RepID=A0ABR3Q588_9TREE
MSGPAVSFSYAPSGALVLEIREPCPGCKHTHPTEKAQWDVIIRATSTWIAENNPVCRRFSGILPWARTLSPSTELAKDRTGTGAPQLPAPVATKVIVPVSVPARSELPIRTPKLGRSVFGCTTCKQRKVKCDQRRPSCANCSRKSGRKCVYEYEFVDRSQSPSEPAQAPTPAPETPFAPESNVGLADIAPDVLRTSAPWFQEASTSFQATAVAATPLNPSVSDTSPDTSPAGVEYSATVATFPMAGPSQPFLGGLSGPPGQLLPVSDKLQRQFPGELNTDIMSRRTDQDWLERCVDTNGLTWFIDASEVIDQRVLHSQQRKTCNDHRQTLLSTCWDAYLGFHGKIPLVLDNVDDLVSTAILQAFVAVGAQHYAYRAKMRMMPYEDHLAGAVAMSRLAVEATKRVIDSAGPDGLAPLTEAKLLMAQSMAFTEGFGGPQASIKRLSADPRTAPSGLEVVSVAICEVIQSLVRGNPSDISPDGKVTWMEEFGPSHRIIPECFGFSLGMVQLMAQTVHVLYGAEETTGPGHIGNLERLKTLYRSLSTTSLVAIYASPQSPRVQAGDLLFRQTLCCLIYMDGFNLGPSDALVARASDAIVELLVDAVAQGIYTARWLLPIIVGGSLCAPERQDSVRSVFEAMALTCGCNDIHLSLRLVEEVWARRDKGQDDWGWREVICEGGVWDVLYL